MEILFPKNISCIYCNAPISQLNPYSLCKKCYRTMAYIDELCNRCGRYGKGASMCTQCFNETYDFDRAYCVLEYNDMMHKEIYRFKYGHNGYLAHYFGQILKDFVEDNQLTYDFITGVPISKQRLDQRGFNQSDLMAQELDKEKFIALFRRKKDTHFLSGLSKGSRMVELQDSFEINDEAGDEMIHRFYNEHSEDKKIKLLIVDDIMTTGSTLHELSKLGKKHFNLDITTLTLCSARK